MYFNLFTNKEFEDKELNQLVSLHFLSAHIYQGGRKVWIGIRKLHPRVKRAWMQLWA
jgi:hypothetical protein